ncbi:MAG: arsenate reductase ArsC, partial [Spirochaetales bacterium]
TAEVGVDISHHTSKQVKDLFHIPFDYVITVCDHAKETCPVFPRKVKHLHVSFEDPPRLAANLPTEEEKLGVYRRVRDEIKAFIQTLPEGLGNG